MGDLLPPKILFESGKSEIGDRNTIWGIGTQDGAEHWSTTQEAQQKTAYLNGADSFSLVAAVTNDDDEQQVVETCALQS